MSSPDTAILTEQSATLDLCENPDFINWLLVKYSRRPLVLFNRDLRKLEENRGEVLQNESQFRPNRYPTMIAGIISSIALVDQKTLQEMADLSPSNGIQDNLRQIVIIQKGFPVHCDVIENHIFQISCFPVSSAEVDLLSMFFLKASNLDTSGERETNSTFLVENFFKSYPKYSLEDLHNIFLGLRNRLDFSIDGVKITIKGLVNPLDTTPLLNEYKSKLEKPNRSVNLTRQSQLMRDKKRQEGSRLIELIRQLEEEELLL